MCGFTLLHLAECRKVGVGNLWTGGSKDSKATYRLLKKNLTRLPPIRYLFPLPLSRTVPDNQFTLWQVPLPGQLVTFMHQPKHLVRPAHLLKASLHRMSNSRGLFPTDSHTHSLSVRIEISSLWFFFIFCTSVNRESGGNKSSRETNFIGSLLSLYSCSC